MAGLDARILRETMSRYLEALRTHRREIDSLNVFPVPDGDTGTNMLMTQQAVEEALRDLDGEGMAEVGERISRAALMGARGNSGVILSQVLRGLCARLSRDERPEGRDLAEALAEAAREARRAVAHPVEGTMLSVMRDAAEAARRAAAQAPGEVAQSALEEGLRSLEGTRGQLPELAEAGVVDAGAKGLVLLFDALASTLQGVPLQVEVGPGGPVGVSDEPQRERAPSHHGFEVMYLLECGDEAVDGLRERLDALGDSLVVVGGRGLYNIHVHTEEPGAAVERGIEAGRPREIRIASLDQQVEECLADQARAVRAAEPSAERSPDEEATPGEQERQRTAVVAAAPGEGIARLFRSLGAVVVRGGPGTNPAVGDLVEAIRRAPSQEVVVLPNHPNVIPAAEQAAREAGKTARVVPTRSVPEGIAAAAAFNPTRSAEENEGYGRDGARAVASAEVARASRDAETAAGRVEAGQFVGIVQGEIRVVGPDPVDLAVELIRPLRRDEHEVLTLLVGEGVSEDDAGRAREALAEALPGVEVEVHRGDQPHYPFLIGLE